MAGRQASGTGTQKRPRRVTETSDYVAFLIRALTAWGDRVADDPAALVHLRDLETALRDQTNRGIWEANQRGQYSQREIAAILGISQQGIGKRSKLGEAVAVAVAAARGGGALVRLADVRKRRGALLDQAGVADRNEREKLLRAV